MKIFLFICALFYIIHSVWTLGHMQRYIAKGQLLCGTQPANNVRVKLIDVGKELSPW